MKTETTRDNEIGRQQETMRDNEHPTSEFISIFIVSCCLPISLSLVVFQSHCLFYLHCLLLSSNLIVSCCLQSPHYITSRNELLQLIVLEKDEEIERQ